MSFAPSIQLLTHLVAPSSYFFLAGLIVADADNKLKYRERAAHGVGLIPPSLRGCLPKKVANMRVHGQVFAWIFFLAGVTLSYVNFVPGANFDFARLEYDIHPDYTTANPQLWEQQNGGPYYTDPRFEDFLFVLGFFLLCDLCASFRKFFQLRIWSGLGRNAFSLYLLHGVIFWSWGAWITLRCLENGVPYWAAILVNFITSYAILVSVVFLAWLTQQPYSLLT